ncbi:hypothetical protein TNCV_4171521 [Trichonephila clavipes]|nr:hypothetical protein TNCV_4171521 [Trichonephila clavipes]
MQTRGYEYILSLNVQIVTAKKFSKIEHHSASLLLLRNPPKDRFLATELITSQWSLSFSQFPKTGPYRHQSSGVSQPLSYLYPADKEVTSAVFMPDSAFKVNCMKGDKD